MTNSSGENGSRKGDDEIAIRSPKTSSLDTLMHLFKANVGPGCYAMAEAVKNGGLILGPILTLLLGVICIHVQHILLQCSGKMKKRHQLTKDLDYAETLEFCFKSISNEKCQKLAPALRKACNIFICITQLGFCCVYLIFVSTNLKQVLDFYGFHLNLSVLISLVLMPVWLSAMITNWKYLGKNLRLFSLI